MFCGERCLLGLYRANVSSFCLHGRKPTQHTHTLSLTHTHKALVGRQMYGKDPDTSWDSRSEREVKPWVVWSRTGRCSVGAGAACPHCLRSPVVPWLLWPKILPRWLPVLIPDQRSAPVPHPSWCSFSASCLVSKGTVLFGSGPGVICLVLACGSGWGPANMVPRPSTQQCWAGQGQMGPELHFCDEPSLVSLHPWATWQEREESVCSHVMERVRRQCWSWDGWLPLENSRLSPTEGWRKVAARSNRQTRESTSGWRIYSRAVFYMHWSEFHL